MNKVLSGKYWTSYTSPEWMAIKISTAVFWLMILHSSNINMEAIPYPCGIFSVVNASFLASKYTLPVSSAFALLLAVLYIAEKRMAITTFLMFLLSLVLFTLEESNGILNRNSLYTMIFLAQAIAYYRNGTRLNEERIQFPIQFIAGGYILAGLSKLKVSGLGWVSDAPLVSIQILKGYCYNYFTTGDIKQLQRGMMQAGFVLNHKLIIECMCGGSLFLELFAWIAVKNKLTAFVYGVLLTCMHIGINFAMNILIGAVFFPMLFFMINPLYLIYLLLSRLYASLRPPSAANTDTA
jgi:hypothetical protein